MTLPADARKALAPKEGDYLGAEVVEGVHSTTSIPEGGAIALPLPVKDRPSRYQNRAIRDAVGAIVGRGLDI